MAIIGLAVVGGERGPGDSGAVVEITGIGIPPYRVGCGSGLTLGGVEETKGKGGGGGFSVDSCEGTPASFDNDD